MSQYHNMSDVRDKNSSLNELRLFGGVSAHEGANEVESYWYMYYVLFSKFRCPLTP